MMFRWTAALVLATLLLAACGGGADRTKALVRLVNASTGYAQLELNVDDQLRQGAVTYGNSASYVEADPGKAYSIRTPASPTSLLGFTPGLSAKKYYSVLAYGAAGALKQLVLDDNNGAPDTNRTLLRVVNAAPDAGTLDVFLTGSGDDLASAVALQAGAAVDTVGNYITVTSGTWRLRVTAAGNSDELRLDVPAITLASRDVVTLVLVPADGGVLVKSLLLVQQGGITQQAATLARVRLATGLTSVTARLGNVDLVSAVLGSAVVTPYKVLPAGGQPLVLNINGTVQASTVQTLGAGLDYTLLLHGTNAVPLVVPISDDNRLPGDRTRAKLRLVNGLAGSTDGLSLTVNASPVASGVVVGTASAYASQVATSSVPVAIASPAQGVLFSATDQSFAAASNYSAFVLGNFGSAAGVTGVVVKDR